jgi:hypothetical protein
LKVCSIVLIIVAYLKGIYYYALIYILIIYIAILSLPLTIFFISKLENTRLVFLDLFASPFLDTLEIIVT